MENEDNDKDINDLTESIQTNLTILKRVMRIPLEQLRINGALWMHAMIISLWNGDHLNPNHVIRQIKLRWKVGERMSMVRVGHNRFVCKIHDVDDLERVETLQPWQIMGCIVLIEPFSTPMNPCDVVFTRIPLLIRFPNLTLEHMSAETVHLLAEDAGVVIEVLPHDGSLPRTAEGFRANIWADIHKPLLRGTYANTLHSGDVWVKIAYINLPSLNYEGGHVYDQAIQELGSEVVDQVCDQTIQLWAQEGLIDQSEEYNYMCAKGPLDLDLNNLGPELLVSLPQPTPHNEDVLQPIPLNIDVALIFAQQPLIIRDVQETPITHQRRGRPPGSRNKNQKSNWVAKGKWKVNEEETIIGKKRKILEIMATEGSIPDPPEPPLSQQRIHESFAPPTPDLQTLDLILHLLHQPDIATHLAAFGILTPQTLDFINNQNQNLVINHD
ncbi:hypothetical protein FRX31_029776 [Thalictrum thalictroides]|uniref:DUF4283 domain-containing protein n=1 Tax=Thalictrum thalictroides TaxID=46969 RepID=A0A7J6V6K2_THATH|nr:hypothetical protein FRX31_029776 [Thalictrum thalictroides]